MMGICRLTYTMLLFIPQSNYYVYFSVHFVSQSISINYPQGLYPPDLLLLYKIDLSNISDRSPKAQSQQQYVLLVGTDVALVVPNSTICPYGALIYVYLQRKGLVYTQNRQTVRSFCATCMGRPQYLDQNNQ